MSDEEVVDEFTQLLIEAMTKPIDPNFTDSASLDCFRYLRSPQWGVGSGILLDPTDLPAI